MLYKLKLDTLPSIAKLYSVRRRTIWQIADPYNILLYVTEGRCNITVDRVTYELNCGDLFFIPKGQNYIRTPINNEFCTLTYIHFTKDEPFTMSDDEAVGEIALLKKDINNSILSGESVADVYDIYIAPLVNACSEYANEIDLLISKARDNFSKNHLESRLTAALYIAQLLAIAGKLTLDRIAGEIRLERSVPPKLKKAISYIRQNYGRSFSLSDMCEYCNVTKQQMTRYFQNELHTTPMRYAMDCRMNRAKELFLSKNQLNIKEVAVEMGFEDPHYFSRVFSKLCKESPSEFINRVRNFDEKRQ